MSPLLKRLAGLLGRTPRAESEPPPGEDSNRPRRRRGGRGRGGGGAAQNAPSAPPPPPPTPVTNRDRPARGRPADSSRGGPPYERRRFNRRLDQPLPEDIAFRPPAEGGDRSILPSRRRPPPGLKATKRVLVAGSRFVPRGPDAEHDETADVRPDDLPVTKAELPEPPEGVRTGRRRRGRRGGRGGRGGRRAGGESAPASES